MGDDVGVVTDREDGSAQRGPRWMGSRDAHAAERRFVIALAATWLLATLVIDPLVIDSRGRAGGIVAGARALGALALLGGFVALRDRRCTERISRVVVGATAAVLSAIAGVIATMTSSGAGVAGPHQATPLLAFVAFAALVAPPWRRGAVLAGTWLGCYLGAMTIAAAVDDRATAMFAAPGAVGMLASATLTQALVLAFAVLTAQRAWRLRHELFESRRLGRYRLMTPIGAGMNEVWLAWDEARRREVALKLLRTPGCAEVTRARFEREAALVRSLRSPHTTRILGAGTTDDGYAYIAFEYLRGMDLEALVTTYGRLDVGRAYNLMVQVCRGLGVAHAAAVVHRDVKPANLHCSDQSGAEDMTRILDFGVARQVGVSRVTLEGTVVGTPAYMSPEAFDGADLTPQSDVYSIGATFYFVLTGEPPFEGETFAELRAAHARAPVVPPSLRAEIDVPRAFEKVIVKCLAKAPVDRYPDAIALRVALEDCAADLPAWSREDAARWWHRARTGRVPMTVPRAERITEVEIITTQRAAR